MLQSFLSTGLPVALAVLFGVWWRKRHFDAIDRALDRLENAICRVEDTIRRIEVKNHW
jgi:hypothetical protein